MSGGLPEQAAASTNSGAHCGQTEEVTQKATDEQLVAMRAEAAPEAIEESAPVWVKHEGAPEVAKESIMQVTVKEPESVTKKRKLDDMVKLLTSKDVALLDGSGPDVNATQVVTPTPKMQKLYTYMEARRAAR